MFFTNNKVRNGPFFLLSSDFIEFIQDQYLFDGNHTMTTLHLLIVAIIQGLTEFLPISSSAHLILLPNLTGMEDQGQTIDVSVHVGTLGAVILYFWRDVFVGVAGIPRLLTGRTDTYGSRLAFLLVIATIPVVVAGLLMNLAGLDDMMRDNVALIGATMLGFGIFLWWADRTGEEAKADTDWNLSDAIKMGLWQAVALIPGTSRSGITITGARMAGYDRTSAAKISMLMSIPTILASATLLGLKIAKSDDAPSVHQLMLDGGLAALFAFGAALLALTLMMRLLRSVNYTPYVIYRVLLGGFLIWWGLT